MPVITLHLSPLSYRIFIARYGEEQPYKIPNSDPYHFLLSYLPISRKYETIKKEFKLLTRKLQVDVNKTLHRHLVKDLNNVSVGKHLHRFHKMQMINFIEAGKFYSDNAYNAMRVFLDLHGVTEDDLPMGTAYKVWQRYQEDLQKKQRKLNTDYIATVHKYSAKYYRINDRMPVPAEHIIRLVNDYYGIGLVNLLYRPVKIKKHNGKSFTYCFDRQIANKYKDERAMLAYLLYTHGLLPPKVISSKFIRILDVKRIYKYINHIKTRTNIYESMAEDLEFFESKLTQSTILT